MTVQRQLAYWAVGIVVFAAILYLLRGILLLPARILEGPARA